MQKRRGAKPFPGEWAFSFLAVGALFGIPGGVLFLGRTLVGDSVAPLLAALAAGVAFLLLAHRYGLEPVGPTRRNPDPEDHVLSARERWWSLAAGCAFLALAFGIHFLAAAFGLREGNPIADGAILVSGSAALMLIIRAWYGVDHAHVPD